MTTTKNRLRIDYKDMPDLKAALGGIEPGQRIVVEFSLMATANNDDFLEADIEEVSYESPEEEAAEEAGEDSNEGADDGDEPGSDSKSIPSGSVTPTADEPVMVEVMRQSASGKKSKSPDAGAA